MVTPHAGVGSAAGANSFGVSAAPEAALMQAALQNTFDWLGSP